MAKKYSGKTRRFGTVAVLLTVLTVVTVILLNGIVTKLALRYGWYIRMTPQLTFPVTDACYDYLDRYVMDSVSTEEPLRIIFCDEEQNIRSSGTQAYVLTTATELAERYPGKVRIEYLNVWENPSVARAYGVKASTSVVVAQGDRSRVCTLKDFFQFSIRDSETPVAYNGEKRLAVAMKAVLSANAPVCYFTMNHGESMSDYSLMFAATDAGYMVNYLDSLSFDIPADCDLLISYNPGQDFAARDSVTGISEIEKLDAYLSRGGKMMVFVSADTFAAGSFGNLEGFLADWGVTFDHAKGASGVEECYSIRDTAHSLSTDGYTILGKVADTGKAGEMMRQVTGTVRLANATGISPADGWSVAGNQWSSGERTAYALLRSYPGAEAWAGGRAVARTDEGFNLITLTQAGESGSAGSLLVCSSVEYAKEAAMQSGVYDNETLLLAAVEAMGKTDTPMHLASQPFSDRSIHILTTAAARRITIALAAVPAGLSLAVGLVVLVRRKTA